MENIEKNNKQVSLEEVKRLLKESEIEYKLEEERKKNIPIFLRQIKKGILVFSILQLLFEIALSLVIIDFTYIWPIVFINYSISTWFSKQKLYKNKLPETTNYFNYGIKISLIVFSIRIILGLIFSILLTN